LKKPIYSRFTELADNTPEYEKPLLKISLINNINKQLNRYNKILKALNISTKDLMYYSSNFWKMNLNS
jgi:23S rRNA A2030 N6-methylase RlmJ